MSTLGKKLQACLVPHFLQPAPQARERGGFLNYRSLWAVSMVVLMGVSLIPLFALTAIDYKLTQRGAQAEMVLRSARAASNARRTVTYFLNERRAVLEFTLREEPYGHLTDKEHLGVVLRNLRAGFSGLADLGVIRQDGRQVAYVGPFDLQGRSYSDQEWFKAAMERGTYVSDLFRGFREIPHVIVAVRSEDERGRPFLLRATLGMEQFVDMLAALEVGEGGDAFLINRQGVLQTPSDYYGGLLEPAGIQVPPFSDHTSHMIDQDRDGREVLVAYAYITDSPFILCVVKPTAEAMRSWMEPRANLMWLSGLSLIAILAAVYIISTYMINAIYEANLRQAQTMERMEQTGRLASIGRLAAGVAHEINNPLAVISERAGLIRDMLTLPGKEVDERLVKNIDIVLESVERCGQITKQLLGFARKVDVTIEDLNVRQVIQSVLLFLEKEAQYRSIDIQVEAPEDLPHIRSDRGKLQQILLNLINNAFQAMSDGGRLMVRAGALKDGGVEVEVEDTGCGIPPKHMKRIFEPFFTTKGASEGSGLGLSITYGLVRKLNGTISVKSELDKGTVFTITLPPEIKDEDLKGENTAG